jgi:hypothetical protein
VFQRSPERLVALPMFHIPGTRNEGRGLISRPRGVAAMLCARCRAKMWGAGAASAEAWASFATDPS